ncbi:unnamed protein product [Dibothriocephalus latus]|uniref:Uncharacterized protein n=1 Tax=Dibothriocephalus latus TaxID=60516 RepID=A0A3P7QWJ3_DIBLA|nr:unnamed protein product [Dibothriocephalus latus]
MSLGLLKVDKLLTNCDGAAVSLIHDSLLYGTPYTQSEFPQIQILTADNSPLALRGSAVVPVSIKDRTIRHHFLVSSELKWNVILGSQSLILLEDDTVITEVNCVEVSTAPPAVPSSIEEIIPDNIPMTDRRAL